MRAFGSGSHRAPGAPAAACRRGMMRLRTWRERLNDFTPDWLALREPADVRARSARLAHLVAARFPRDRAVRALDIATGTGANMRYMAEHLPPRQQWLLVDGDPVLLGEVAGRTHSWAVARGFEVTSDEQEQLIRGEGLMCRVATRR